MKALAINLRKARRGRGLTQENCAAVFGVKRSLYGAWEEGRSQPAREPQRAIIKEYGITNWDRFSEDPEYDIHNQPPADGITPALTELQDKFMLADAGKQQEVRDLLGVGKT